MTTTRSAAQDEVEPQRVDYFNGQFLQEEDFQAEQAYHVGQRRRLTRLVRGAGIVYGLDVAVADAAEGQLRVTAGLAVDSDGNLLAVPAERFVTVDAKGLATGVLVIEYGEVGDRLVEELGGGMPTRQIERPTIRFVSDKASVGTGVTLARLRLNEKQIVPLGEGSEPLDKSVRREADLSLSGDLSVAGATTIGDPGRRRPLKVHGAIAADEGLSGASLSVSGTATVEQGGLTVRAGGLTVEKDGLTVRAGGVSVEKDGLTVQDGGLSVDKGQAVLKEGLSVSGGPTVLNSEMLRLKGGEDANHGLLFNSTIDGPEFRAYQGFVWKNGTAGATERMRLDASGKLGINTAAPSEQVEIGINGAENTATNFLSLFNGGPASTQESRIVWKNGDSKKFAAAIASRPGTSYNSGDLRLQTAKNNVLEDRLIIDADGNVAIGGAPEGFRLKVQGGTTSLQQAAWEEMSRIAPDRITLDSSASYSICFRDSCGVVHIQALIKTVPNRGLTGNFAVLPQGYQPRRELRFLVPANMAGGGQVGVIRVDTSGLLHLDGNLAGDGRIWLAIAFRQDN